MSSEPENVAREPSRKRSRSSQPRGKLPSYLTQVFYSVNRLTAKMGREPTLEEICAFMRTKFDARGDVQEQIETTLMKAVRDGYCRVSGDHYGLNIPMTRMSNATVCAVRKALAKSARCPAKKRKCSPEKPKESGLRRFINKVMGGGCKKKRKRKHSCGLKKRKSSCGRKKRKSSCGSKKRKSSCGSKKRKSSCGRKKKSSCSKKGKHSDDEKKQKKMCKLPPTCGGKAKKKEKCPAKPKCKRKSPCVSDMSTDSEEVDAAMEVSEELTDSDRGDVPRKKHKC